MTSESEEIGAISWWTEEGVQDCINLSPSQMLEVKYGHKLSYMYVYVKSMHTLISVWMSTSVVCMCTNYVCIYMYTQLYIIAIDSCYSSSLCSIKSPLALNSPPRTIAPRPSQGLCPVASGYSISINSLIHNLGLYVFLSFWFILFLRFLNYH